MIRSALGTVTLFTIALVATLAAAAPREQTVRVLPPARPAEFADVMATGSTSPIRPDGGRGGAIRTAAEPAALSEKAIVDRASAALTGVTSLTADFTQVGGDGKKLTGIMYLQRPGKLRFEYEKPSTMEVVSDGSTVLVRDRKTNSAEPYPISQTPLKFLLAAKIDLSRDVTVTAVAADPDGVRVAIEDSSTFGGTSKITLSFDPEIRGLKRWRVVDPQGYTTTVTLSDIELNRVIDPRIFMLNYMRPVE